MKNKKLAIFMASIALTGIMLTGCGSRSETTENYSTGAGYDMAATDNLYGDSSTTAKESAEADPSAATVDDVQESALTTNRKLIRNMNLSVETQEYESLCSTIEQKVTQMGGYIEQSDKGGRSYYSNDSTRYASYTCRVPSDQLDDFAAAVSEVSNITDKSESITDITLQYVDVESHKEALETEQNKLLQLMKEATDMEDIISIEAQLTEVRYQIESMESQIKIYDNQVDYSTVYIYVTEVAVYTPADAQSILEEISSGFKESLYHVGQGLRSFGIGIIVYSPYLLIIGIVIAVVAIIIVKVIKKLKKNTMHVSKKQAKLDYLARYGQTNQKEEKND